MTAAVMSPDTASGVFSVMVALWTAFVKVAVKVALALPSLTSMVMVCVPFRIFWNSAAVLAHSKVSCVPLVTFVRVFFTAPSSFSVTVNLSPSASLGVYLKLNAAVLLPRFTPLAPLVLVIVGGVFVDTVPSSETKSVEGRTKAGRMPYE